MLESSGGLSGKGVANSTAASLCVDRSCERRRSASAWEQPGASARGRLSGWVLALGLMVVGPTQTSAFVEDCLVDPIDGACSLPRESFYDWMRDQADISWAKLAANVSPNGAARGAVIASPSRHEPDYFFHWIRDAALVMDVVVEEYGAAPGRLKTKRRQMMDDYVVFSRENQLAETLTGLGEPKFHADGRVYNGPWGRPQNDGPALRALTLIRYAHILMREGETDYVRSKLYKAEIPAHTLIKADLEFVAHHWREKSFDLWEEVKGDHFYTRLVQLAALEEGAELAYLLGDHGASQYYLKEARLIAAELARHWDRNAGLIRVTLNRVEGVDYKQSGLDTAVILGVLHSKRTVGDFSPGDDRVMATAEALDRAFGDIYSINRKDRFSDVGTAIGRYPEDRYSGHSAIWEGNPWVLTTAALAEYHYELAAGLQAGASIQVTSINQAFVQSVLAHAPQEQGVRAGQIFHAGSADMKNLIAGLIERGDLYMNRIRLHANPDGSLSEQIDRNSGYMVSARDLTWSYASFLTAFWARP